MMLVFEVAFFAAPALVTAMLPNEGAVNAYYQGLSAAATLAQFATMGLTGLGFVFALRVVHGRGFWSMVGPPLEALWDMRRAAFGAGALLLLIEFIPPTIQFSELAETRNFIRWIFLLPPALIVLLIQVGTEEIYFRGYLQQQFACISDRPIVWMGIPSCLFGLAHYFNGFGVGDGLIYMFWAILLGMACADLTARTGNIGAAVGLHLANNFFALMIVGTQGWPSSGLALFLYPYEDPGIYAYGTEVLIEPWAVVEIISLALGVLILWLAARIAVRR